MCVLITGASGLVGSESVKFFTDKGFEVVGIDNDMRGYFFGGEGSTRWRAEQLKKNPGYQHHDADIRNTDEMGRIFRRYGNSCRLIIHAAAQPSHDWAAKEPATDFSVNAVGTLNLLENMRLHTPDAVFIFVSTNKVYGDTPNRLSLVETETRWEISPDSRFAEGIDESMSIDQSKHSLFGVSKAAADLLVQEYGRYFGLKTACFRAGCITGPAHSAAELHGFLAYLMKCAVVGREYQIYGYKGKQVRDNIHSYDLVNAFFYFYEKPRIAEVYNIGGGRFSNCSVLEAIEKCKAVSGREVRFSLDTANRIGDHIWWISSLKKFKNHYPEWDYQYDLDAIFEEIYSCNVDRWTE